MKLNTIQVLGLFKMFEHLCKGQEHVKQTDEVEIKTDETSFSVFVNGERMMHFGEAVTKESSVEHSYVMHARGGLRQTDLYFQAECDCGWVSLGMKREEDARVQAEEHSEKAETK